MTDRSLLKLRQDVRRNLKLDTFQAVLGDGGTPPVLDEPGQPGFVRVRYQTASGFSAPVTLPFEAVMIKRLDAPVIVGYNYEGDLAVLTPNQAAQRTQGTNTLENNPADPNVSYWIQQQRIVTLASHPISSSTNSMLVVVQPWLLIDLSTDAVTYFAGQQVDLTASIPSNPGEWCIACLFWKTDNTIEVIASTPKPSQTDLGIDDIQECVSGRTAGSQPVWAWQLYYGQTGITGGAQVDGGDDYMDLRQMVNSYGVATGGGGGSDDALWVGWVGL